MRDKPPTFDQLEVPPAEGAPIDGLSDAQWVARRDRRERFVRIVFGLAFGGIVGLVSAWHWGLVTSHSRLAHGLIVGGSMVLFATLFAQRRDDEAVGHATWILLPEWAMFDRLPLWALVMVFSACLAVVCVLAAIVMLGHFVGFVR